MRAAFGILSLLVVVAIVGLLAKKQMASVSTPTAMPAAPGAAPAAPAANPKEAVQQFKQAVDAAVVPPRAMPDEPK
jgi:hypothetical protein